MVHLTIQGIEVEVSEGTSVLEAARIAGVEIPTLCYHPDLKPFGSCGLCIVKQVGNSKIIRACATPVSEGMNIIAHDEELHEVRKSILELTLSTHPTSCLTCVRNNKCELQRLAIEFGLREQPFGVRLYDNVHKDDSTKAIVLDPVKCVKCGRCVQVCQNLQGAYALEFCSRGEKTTMSPAFNLPLNSSPCIKCGQCITHCPVGAIYEWDDTDEFMKAIRDPEKTVMVQIAPSVRVALGEEFGMKPGELSTGKIYAALKRLGSDYVFDTNFGADLTIMEEGHELVERITKGGVLPQFTSCCPGWVNYCEEYYPELIENLSSAKSPMMMQGAVTKTYTAEKLGVPIEKVYSVAIMPCTAKKGEITRDKGHAYSSGEQDVDLVLTTRELARLIKENGILFNEIKEIEADDPLGEYTGAGTIFGVTGGVMEAALRTAYKALSGKELEIPEIHLVRGLGEVKEGEVEAGGKRIRVAIVHGMANAKELLDKVKKDKLEGKVPEYDFIEIMACRGGCIAGGGQPLGTDDQVRNARIEGLYKDDKACDKRCSHQNESIKRIYDEYLGKPLSEKAHHLLHTEFEKKALYKEDK